VAHETRDCNFRAARNDFSGLRQGRETQLLYLHHTSKHIRSINIRWLDEYAPADVSTAIKDLFSNCPDVLVITHQLDGAAANQLMSVNPITVIATHCNRLVKLYKRGGLNDDDLVALGNGCPRLASVGTLVWGITDVGLQAVARNGALSTLRLQNCCKLTDEGLQAAVAFCPLLESVDLSYCTLSDASLIALGQHCHNLRELNIQGTSMTDEGLLAIAAGCLRLEKLVAKQNDFGPAIEAIARSCPRLRTLVVAEVEVATQAVLAVAECCPLLEELGLCGCEAIGDEDITAVVRGCPALRWLDIAGTAVTALDLRAVRDHCKELQHIVLQKEMYPGGV
jgi:hypothetical protein